MDYYKILDLKQNASDTAIKQAYRKWSIKWHPDKNIGKDETAAAKKFEQTAEAYCILTSPKLRAIFDQYGEKGLKKGAMGHEGWAFSSSPLDIFSEFFGNTSPFAEFFGSDSGLSNNFAVTGTKQAEKAEAIEANLYCTLEELYYGCRKSQKVVRQRLESDGKTTSANERVFAVQVGKGWKAGTKITFPGEGDEAYNTPAGDIILALKEQPHPRFTRQGNDLHYTAKLSLNQALTGCTVEVQTLDRRVLPIAVSDIATPGGRQVVKGEGMPKAKNPKKRGNLVITYAIVFPTELSVQAKDSLRKILP